MTEIFYGIHPTPFGDYLMLSTNEHRVMFGAFIDESTKDSIFLCIQKKWPSHTLTKNHALTEPLVEKMFDPNARNHIPLALQGTPFQKAVWHALLTIKAGEVTTYKTIAQKIGRPTAVRAVANAIANNNIAVLVPCHRVIATSGALGGYRWGVTRKQALLLSEQGK